MTTHYLEEAEQLCDRIAIINNGQLVACDTTRDLLKRVDGKRLTVTVSALPPELPPSLTAFAPIMDSDNRLVFTYKPSEQPIAAILDALRSAQLEVVDLSTEETDLEDIFLQLTARA